MKKYLNDKLKVLTLIANLFNSKHITWALGGSSLLYLNNITDNFNDIDIEVSEEDITKVLEVMEEIGTKKESTLNEDYKTKFFFEFDVRNVSIDIIAGFVIINNNESHYFPLKKEDIKDSVTLNDEKMYLQSVKKWREYYLLMNRFDKVKMIDEKV